MTPTTDAPAARTPSRWRRRLAWAGLLLGAFLTMQAALTGLYHPHWWLRAPSVTLLVATFGWAPILPPALTVLSLSRLTGQVPAPVHRAAAPTVTALTAWAVLGSAGAYAWFLATW